LPELSLHKSLSDNFTYSWHSLDGVLSLRSGSSASSAAPRLEGNNLIPKETHDPASTILMRMEFNPTSLENLHHPKERACPYLLAF